MTKYFCKKSKGKMVFACFLTFMARNMPISCVVSPSLPMYSRSRS